PGSAPIRTSREHPTSAARWATRPPRWTGCRRTRRERFSSAGRHCPGASTDRSVWRSYPPTGRLKGPPARSRTTSFRPAGAQWADDGNWAGRGFGATPVGARQLAGVSSFGDTEPLRLPFDLQRSPLVLITVAAIAVVAVATGAAFAPLVGVGVLLALALALAV